MTRVRPKRENIKFKLCQYCEMVITYETRIVCVDCHSRLTKEYEKNESNISLDDYVEAALTTKLLES